MPVTVSSVVAFVLILCVSGLGIASPQTGLRIVNQVNIKLPEKDHFAQYGWYPAKSQRLRREYRRLYPEGRLLFRQDIVTEAMLICLLLAAWL